jgi:putative membrane protein
MKNNLMRAVINALKGSLIGAANVIPGVSGGTIAVITRLYDDLIAAISGFFRTGWKKNTLFLLPIVVGVAIGIVLFARVVGFFLGTYQMQTVYFFMGLILGSLPFLVKTTLAESFRPIYLVPCALALGLLIWMSLAGRPPLGEAITDLTLTAAAWIFVTGVISSATMVIPGVSGSFILLLIGMYETFRSAAETINIPILAVLVPGFVVGIVVVSKLINFLLSRHHGITYWAIIGLVLGSVVAIWPRADSGAWAVPTTAVAIVTSGAALVVGFLLAYFLGSDRKQKTTETDT